MSQPIYLTKVEVNGAETFSYQFFDKLLTPLTTHSDYTLEKLLSEIKKSQTGIYNTGVFQDVKVNLETDYYANYPNVKSYNNEKSIPTKVTFDLNPTSLNVNQGFLNFNNEEMLNLNLTHLNNNFFENGETVSIGVDYNPYKPFDHLLTSAKFVTSLKNPIYKLFVDINVGEKLDGTAGLLYKNDVQIFNGVRIKSDPSIINSINYHRVDYLNEFTKTFPISGYKLNIHNELANSFKTNITANFYQSLFNNYITAHLETNFGISKLDKFHFGGFNSFVGLEKNALSGSQFYKVQSSIYSKTPFFNNGGPYPLRLYGTAIIGKMDDSGVSSYGLGLKYFNHWANFDLGYYVSSRLDNETAGLRNGFQFSVSIGASNV